MAKSRLSHDLIRSNATAATQRNGNIRERVRNLTLRALRDRRFEPTEIKAVLSAMTQGIASGAARRSGDVRGALSQAFTGLDEALGKAAETSHLALREFAARARDLNDREVRQALDNLRRLEKNFLSTVGKAARGAQPKIKREFRDILIHAQRTGTDTGDKVAATLSEFSTTVGSIMTDSARAGINTTRDAGARLTELASGVFAGMADAARAEGPHGASAPRRRTKRRVASHKK